MASFLFGLFIGGPAGWFANQFLGRPYTRLQDLRTQAKAALDTAAKVSVLASPRLKVYADADQALNTAGIEIGAFYETLSPLSRWVFHQLGYDLPQANGALIELSRSLLEKDARTTLANEVERSLKLKLSPRPPTGIN